MKKNIIAIAVAAAVIAPTMASAEGDVKVYGRAQVEIGSLDYQNTDPDGDPNTDDDPSGVSVADNAMGRLGVVATEDLGGGMKGIAKFEFKLDTADGDSSGSISLTKRELMVGLKGGFGTVQLGRLKSEYKYAGGVKYDPFVATFLEARGNGGMSGGGTMVGGVSNQYGHNSFNSDMIGYKSPKLGPITLGLTYGPEEDDGTMTAAIKGSWKMGEFVIALLDTGDKLGTAAYSAFKAGGQLRFGGGNHKISLQYEVTDYDDGNAATDDESPVYFFGGYQGSFGKSTFVAQFGAHDADVTTVGGATTNDATYMAVGAIYKFSKLTRVFGGFRSEDRDDDSGEDVISIGMRKDFK